MILSCFKTSSQMMFRLSQFLTTQWKKKHFSFFQIRRFQKKKKKKKKKKSYQNQDLKRNSLTLDLSPISIFSSISIKKNNATGEWKILFEISLQIKTGPILLYRYSFNEVEKKEFLITYKDKILNKACTMCFTMSQMTMTWSFKCNKIKQMKFPINNINYWMTLAFIFKDPSRKSLKLGSL